MLHPVRASVGDRLVVVPGDVDRPIAVVRHTGGAWRFLRAGPPNFGALIGMELDGVIHLRLSAGVPLAAHPLARQA